MAFNKGKNKWWILSAIVILAAVLRLPGLDKYPAGFTPDEAAFGYNAYSLLKTGHDEWGIAFWQLPFTNLRSFGDYKMPLYAFLTVPTVAVLGLNEFAVRLPNAVLGILAVIVIYLLGRKISGNEVTAQIAALLLTVSPWHISLSRGAFEANLITFFLPLGIYLYLQKKYKLSIIIFSLSLYSYHSSRLIAPLALIGLFLAHKPRLKKSFSSLILLLLLSIPAVYSLVFSDSRAADISIFHPDDNWAAMATGRLNLINTGMYPLLARLLINKITYTTLVFLDNYKSYFSFRFLFSSGPTEATYGMLPGVGVLYLIQLPFLLIFGYQVLTSRNRNYYYLLLLILISPVAAALSKGPGLAANRAAFMIIPLTLMSSIGLSFIAKKAGKLFSLLLLLLLLLSAGSFIKTYIAKSPIVHTHSMGYGFRQMAQYLSENEGNYSRIRISRSLSEPHIYLAFYQKTDPRAYQAAALSWSDFEKKGFRFLDQYDGYTLGKYRFGDLNYERHDPGNILYIGRLSDYPIGTRIKIISIYPDATPAIVSSVFPD